MVEAVRPKVEKLFDDESARSPSTRDQVMQFESATAIQRCIAVADSSVGPLAAG